MVVAAVSDQAVGSAAVADRSRRARRDAVKEWDQLGDVVAVAARDREGERDPAPVDEDKRCARCRSPRLRLREKALSIAISTTPVDHPGSAVLARVLVPASLRRAPSSSQNPNTSHETPGTTKTGVTKTVANDPRTSTAASQ